jgi:hypothetical protein
MASRIAGCEKQRPGGVERVPWSHPLSPSSRKRGSFRFVPFLSLCYLQAAHGLRRRMRGRRGAAAQRASPSKHRTAHGLTFEAILPAE